MNPAVVKLLALAAALVLAAGGGWAVRGWKEDAARLHAERQERDAYIETVQYLATKVQDMGQAREADRIKAGHDRTAFQRRLRDAGKAQTKLIDCPPQGGPAPVFTADFVGLWNDGLAIGLPKALGAGQPQGPGGGTDLPTADDILQNLGQNAEACNQLRTRALECKAYVEAIEGAP